MKPSGALSSVAGRPIARGEEACPFPEKEFPDVELGRHKENSSKSRRADALKISIK
jgi:hypothetical protein